MFNGLGGDINFEEVFCQYRVQGERDQFSLVIMIRELCTCLDSRTRNSIALLVQLPRKR